MRIKDKTTTNFHTSNGKPTLLSDKTKQNKKINQKKNRLDETLHQIDSVRLPINLTD